MEKRSRSIQEEAVESATEAEHVPEPGVDDVRRKLLRSAAVVGGAFAVGQLPYTPPSVRSFFGTRDAWAQPSGAIVNAVRVTQPTNLPIVIITGGVTTTSQVSVSRAAETESAVGTFSVQNVGTETVVFHPPTITGPGAMAFSIDGAELDMVPQMAPFEMQPMQTAVISVRFSCPVEGEGVLQEAVVELDIKTTSGGAVDGVVNVPVSGKCGTLACQLVCGNVESQACFDDGGIQIQLVPGQQLSDRLKIVNVGTLSFDVTAVAIDPALPAVVIAPDLGPVDPGDNREQTFTLVCDAAFTAAVTAGNAGAGNAIVISAQSVDLVNGEPVPLMCPSATIFASCVQG